MLTPEEQAYFFTECLKAVEITVFQFFGITQQASKASTPAFQLWERVLMQLYRCAVQLVRILNWLQTFAWNNYSSSL